MLTIADVKLSVVGTDHEMQVLECVGYVRSQAVLFSSMCSATLLLTNALTANGQVTTPLFDTRGRALPRRLCPPS